jgi:hypothetical protein
VAADLAIVAVVPDRLGCLGSVVMPLASANAVNREAVPGGADVEMRKMNTHDKARVRADAGTPLFAVESVAA